MILHFILKMIWTFFHCSYSQRCMFMLRCLMARRRDAGPKCKTEIYCCGWFLKDIDFCSASVTLVHSQYPSVSCVINGVLKKQLTISQLFNLLLYFSFCISIIILQHLLLILSIISVLDVAHIAINSNNNNIIHHTLLKKWGKASLPITLQILHSPEAVPEPHVAP